MNGISSITTSYPLWFVLICIAVGVLYSWALYSKKPIWSKRVNNLLAALRFLSVTIICLLLLDWTSELNVVRTEKPIVVVAIDNSESIPMTTDSTKLNKIQKNLYEFKSKLEKAGREVIFSSYQNEITELDSIQFNHPASHLDKLIKSSIDGFEGMNLAGLVLLSDGIYNVGQSPEFCDYRTKIFPIAVGDTSRRVDIKIRSAAHNKIAYKDNIFPINVEIENQGYANEKTQVQIFQNNTLLDSKDIVFNGNFNIQEVPFQLSSKKEGIQHYVVIVKPLDGESSIENNTKHIYIEVLNGKEKVLCVALTPHPDIKALKSAIENNSNIEFQTHIITRGDQLKTNEKYDLIIFHQVPNKLNKGNELIEQFHKKKTPALFILGNQSNLSKFNAYNSTLTINGKIGQTDEISPYFNSKFDLFSVNNEIKTRLPKFPPLTVPYGNYQLKGGTDVILKQQVGQIETQNPALVVNVKNEIKEGVLAGEGIWRWRLGEYQQTENTEAFDQIIQKTVQLLSAKNDKRKFRVNTNSNNYNQFEKITFHSESYNDLFEPIFNNEIEIKLSNESGVVKNLKYTPTSSFNTSYSVNNLPAGLYKYTATTTITGKQHYSKGQFVIKKQLLESLNLTADHRLLNMLAKKNGGNMVYPDQLDELLKYFNGKDVVSLLHTDTKRDALINHKWIFFLIFGLVIIEWALRKYKGGY